MRKARVYMMEKFAGYLEEIEKNKRYRFIYLDDYNGYPISVSMPITQKEYLFDQFPPFFDGLLPEGPQLENLLRQMKIDRVDLFTQLITVGKEMVGAVTVESENE